MPFPFWASAFALIGPFAVLALGTLGAAAFAYLLWHAPRCRQVPARAYYTPPTAEQCARISSNFKTDVNKR